MPGRSFHPHCHIERDNNEKAAGGRGAAIGRNAWGGEPVTEIVRTFKAVILDGETLDQAVKAIGLTGANSSTGHA
jgi:hypothetical protein